MSNAQAPAIPVEAPVRVMIAHPEAGEIAYFLRQATREYVPQLAGADYHLIGHAAGVTFTALWNCRVLLISHAFFNQLRLHAITDLPGTLGLAVVVLDEPGAYPTAHAVLQAINTGVQGWFITPYRTETGVRLLWRIRALTNNPHRAHQTLPAAVSAAGPQTE